MQVSLFMYCSISSIVIRNPVAGEEIYIYRFGLEKFLGTENYTTMTSDAKAGDIVMLIWCNLAE